MTLFSPITEISNVGILVENCLENNEGLIEKLLKLPSSKETRRDGSFLGDVIFASEGDSNTASRELYKEMHEIMINASSIFLNKNNQSHEDYKKKQGFYKFLVWSTPHEGMSSHYDHWEVDGEKVSPAITNLLYLTSDFEGGELYFPDQDIAIKPKAGDVISFFSKTQHQVREVRSGRRITTQLFLFDNV
jgi:hypothetical protein